jgi:hypothetical protein
LSLTYLVRSSLRPGVYPLSIDLLQVLRSGGPRLLRNIRLAFNKHSSLFCLAVSDEEIKFYDIDTWWLLSIPAVMAGEADGAVWAAGGGAAIIETSPVGVAPELKKLKIVFIYLF